MTSDNIIRDVEQVMAHAELLYNEAQVEAALDRMAAEINAVLHDKDPVLLCLMLGAVVVTGKLMTRLSFPLRVEYVHASRYRGQTSGGELAWQHMPGELIRDRCVLVIDDILDEGITMANVVEACRQAGAGEIHTAVLVDKNISGEKKFPAVDFTGLTVPDKYVFGYGMDYKEYLRNANGIYAVND